jgi:hypothetical protein
VEGAAPAGRKGATGGTSAGREEGGVVRRATADREAAGERASCRQREQRRREHGGGPYLLFACGVAQTRAARFGDFFFWSGMVPNLGGIFLFFKICSVVPRPDSNTCKMEQSCLILTPESNVTFVPSFF